MQTSKTTHGEATASPQRKPQAPDTAQLRRLAVEAQCDPRTIAKRLAGGDLKGVVRERVDAVLTEHGYIVPEVAS